MVVLKTHKDHTILLLMLATALILLAAGLVLYPLLIVAIRNMNLSTIQPVTTPISCPSEFESFESHCYKIVKYTVEPDETSCQTKDKTNPPSTLAHVNNATAIARVQRYINSKEVPGSYLVNLFIDNMMLAYSDGLKFVHYSNNEEKIFDPYIQGKVGYISRMRYFGAQVIIIVKPNVSYSLLCETTPIAA